MNNQAGRIVLCWWYAYTVNGLLKRRLATLSTNLCLENVCPLSKPCIRTYLDQIKYLPFCKGIHSQIVGCP